VQSIAFKMLFRKKGTASTIVAIALLVALLASVSALMNNISAQTTALTQFAGVGGTYIVVSGNSAALSDSRISAGAANVVGNDSNVRYVLPQVLFDASLTTSAGNSSVLTVTAVDDPLSFLRLKGASLSGAGNLSVSEAVAGLMLARLNGININDTVRLSVGDRSVEVKVVDRHCRSFSCEPRLRQFG
jgi:hypothetical protein